MLCIVIKGPSFSEASEQIRLSQNKAGILEFRCDLFSFEAVDALMQQTSLPVILTLRPKRYGGGFSGSEKKRLFLLNRLAALKPAYIDIEHDVDEAPEGVKIIRSYHNFTETPQALPLDLKGDIVKIAAMAGSTADALRLLLSVKFHPHVIGISMGEKGSVSRILSPFALNPFTYACLKESTAPGQLLADELLGTYHFQELNTETKIYGLIGNPVSQSPSHQTHNRFFRQSGLNAVYVKMTVDASELLEFLSLAKQLNFQGLSVTMPLKEAVIPYLDEIDPAAKQIGAVNTLAFRGGKIKGYNTDGLGALNAIERQGLVSGKKVLVIGAGGTAKAVAYEAQKRGASVFIYNRTFEKAQKLARRMNYRPVQDFEGGFDIYVNCTPASAPVDSNLIASSSLVMDVNHFKTKFLIDSGKKGCSVIAGEEMFVLQAKEQFRIYIDMKRLKINI